MTTTPNNGRDPVLSVTNFGPIVEANVSLRPLTVFVGPSNTESPISPSWSMRCTDSSRTIEFLNIGEGGRRHFFAIEDIARSKARRIFRRKHSIPRSGGQRR